MPSQREGYAQKTTLVGTRVSDDEDPQGLEALTIRKQYLIITNN